MKTSVSIISIILVLSVFLPFLYFIYNGLKNSNKISKKIEALVKANNIRYSIKDFWHNNFIGLSDDAKILTYIRVNDQIPINIEILLNELVQCDILHNYVKGRDKTIHLDRLDLKFLFKSSEKGTIILNFYNSNDDFAEDYELKRIEKWHQIIQESLTENITSKISLSEP
jgi:hypothetical protein